jgi:hypothetical protein
VRRCGELLTVRCEAAERSQKRTAPISRYDAGAAAKMSERQVKTAVRVANVPAKAFEFAVESDAPPTWSVTLTPGLRCGARGVA